MTNTGMPSDCLEFDVAIVGGGLVGASLATALAQLGLKIALLEAVTPRASQQPSYDDRTLALSMSSCRILQGLGVWPELENNATAIRKIWVSEKNRPGRVIMDPAELDLECFGHVLEARVFGVAIMEGISRLPSVSFICPARVSSIEIDSSSAQLIYQLDDGERRLKARLLVGADGAGSEIRKALGIEVEQYDYGQKAIICNVSPELPHAGQAFECFTSTGPFALLPHVNDRCGLVWSVGHEAADELLALSDEEFLNRAQSIFGSRLGVWKKIGKRSVYPLSLVRALDDVRQRALILGNAAHAIHPIGAQGFNLGLRDVAVLAEILADALLKDPSVDIGASALLQKYSDWRAPDQQSTIAYTDGLARLYANPTQLACAARGLGMLAHAIFPSLRRQLAVRAMGYRGKTPRLALGESISVSPS
jgi:2-octaprenyl-6-methoxyphenol hydroxylase